MNVLRVFKCSYILPLMFNYDIVRKSVTISSVCRKPAFGLPCPAPIFSTHLPEEHSASVRASFYHSLQKHVTPKELRCHLALNMSGRNL